MGKLCVRALNHLPIPMSCLLSSRSGVIGDRQRGLVDQVDDNWLCGVLALIAATVSYLHMHMLVELHGQPGWVAASAPRPGHAKVSV
jgi:hypothetical protein